MASLFDRKVKTLFVRFDLNGSGSIEEADFDQWADKLISFGNLQADKQAALRLKIKQLWQSYFAPADKDGDGKVSSIIQIRINITQRNLKLVPFHIKIELAELSDYMKQAANDQRNQALLQETLPLIFDAIDVNKDGSISKGFNPF
jgi:Ca2+-binding EF-hand superfamily protein